MVGIFWGYLGVPRVTGGRWQGAPSHNRPNKARLHGIAASLLVGRAARVHQPLPGPGQQLAKVSKHMLQSLSPVHIYRLAEDTKVFFFLATQVALAQW